MTDMYNVIGTLDIGTASRRVLLIDDEPDIRDVAQLTLDITMGWQMSVACNGCEGVALARHHELDLILLDIMMPGMDGFATLLELRADPATRDIPVVFLSAKASHELDGRVRTAGAVGLISKPFNPLTLGSEVCAMMGWC